MGLVGQDHQTFDGLEVSPVIPSGWDGFEATRIFRGVRYEIRVKRKGSGNDVRLEVDGKPELVAS